MSFSEDLRQGLSLWRGDPTLPRLIVGIAVFDAVTQVVGPSFMSGAVTVGLAGFLLVLLTIGLAGTIRVWYARRLVGDGLRLGAVARLSLGFFGRFLLLGLLYVVTVIGFGLMASLALAAFVGDDATRQFLASFVGATIANYLFAFAPPYLALVHPGVLTSFSAGRTLSALPSSRVYKALPAVLVGLLEAATPLAGDSAWSAIPALLGPIAMLVFAGPTTLFVLRHDEAARIQPV